MNPIFHIILGTKKEVACRMINVFKFLLKKSSIIQEWVSLTNSYTKPSFFSQLQQAKSFHISEIRQTENNTSKKHILVCLSKSE